MAQNYIRKKYPAWRYKPDCQPVIVLNKDEDEKHLADGWARTPKVQAVEMLPEEMKENEESVKTVEKMVDGIAAMTNALLRLPKVRSKKDVQAVADLLNIDLRNTPFKLKEMKAKILAEAEKMPELAKFLEAQNEHSHTSH